MVPASPEIARADVDAALRTLRPIRPQSAWDWASTSMRLPDGESSSLGGFDRDRAGIFRRIMDVVTARRTRVPLSQRDPYAHLTERLWLISSAQLGKTINAVYLTSAWQALHYPHLPIGMVWPRLELKKSQIRGRLEPLWRANPALASLMPPPESDDYESAIGDRMWRLNTGLKIRMLTGAIANDLRANPLAAVFLDEYDAIPLDVGDQGNPLRLVEDRGRTWGPDFLILGATTPTTVDAHGWKTLCAGTHERLMVTCPACQAIDWLNPEQVVPVDSEDPTEIRRRDLAAWTCRHCGTMHRTSAVVGMRTAAMDADTWCPGTWRIDDDHPLGIWEPSCSLDANGRLKDTIPPPDSETRSFHLNILYGRVWTVGRFLAEQMVALQGNAEDKRAFWNTARAEVWLPQGLPDITDADKRAIVVDRPRGVVPNAAQYLVLTLDQQANTDALAWFPWVLRAIAPGGESWLVDTGQVPSLRDDPGSGGWAGVDALCARVFKKEDGTAIRITIAAMDGANGNLAPRVRHWAAQEPARRILFWGNPRLKLDEPWRLYVPGQRAKIPWPSQVRGWELNSNYWKDRVDDRRRRLHGTPGWHLPTDTPGFYLRSLWDSETRVVVQRQITGVGVREIIAWQPSQQADSQGNIMFRRDNHWLDCEMAAAAVAAIHGWDDSGLAPLRRKLKRKFGKIGEVR
jgi:phage terminase large subunit GpA-like protein